MSSKVIAENYAVDEPKSRASRRGSVMDVVANIMGKPLERKNSVADALASITSLMNAKRKKEQFIFNPNGKFCTRWDPLMFLLLVFITFATPFEIAFVVETELNFMFFLNKVIDLIFFADIFVNFNMMYKDEDGSVINDRGRIASRYLKSWFIIDFTSIIPFDLIGLLQTSDDNSKSGSATNLKMIRLIKLLRLLKLLRVLKSSRIIRRWEAQIGMSYAKLTVCQFAVVLGTTVHWTACIWRLAPTIFHSEEQNNWLKQYTFLLGDLPTSQFMTSTVNQQYSASLYASISLLLSGGMPSDIDPTSPAEQITVGFLTIVTAMLYVYLIGSITAVLESMDQPTKMFRQNMDNLNQFCDERNLSSHLRVRLRGYLRSAQHVYRDKFYGQMLMTLSPMLQGEVTMATHEAWISTLSFLRGVDAMEKHSFSIMLSTILESRCYAQKEYVIREGELCTRMFIIQKGIMAVCGNIVGKGGYVGEDIIIAVEGFHFRRHYSSTALTFVDVHIIESANLATLLSSGDFEDIKLHLRKRAIRLVMFRLIVKASKLGTILKSLEELRKETERNNRYERYDHFETHDARTDMSILKDSMQAMMLQQQQTAAQVKMVVEQQQNFASQLNFISAHLGVPSQGKTNLIPIARPANGSPKKSLDVLLNVDSEDQWWYWDDDCSRVVLDIAHGSFTLEQLRIMHTDQKLSARTPVWTKRLGQDQIGQPNWKPLAVALRENFLKLSERNLNS